MIAQTNRCSFCEGDLTSFWAGSPFCRCRSCGLIIRSQLPTQDELDKLYPAPGAAPIVPAAETGNMEKSLARQYVAGLLSTLGRQNAKVLRILDFGAGTGALA